jgi:hypothetical protein
MTDAPKAKPDSASSSPLGSSAQYQHAPRLPSLHNLVSITGATKNDPAGKLAREPVLSDPDWASPLRGPVRVMQGFAGSLVIYWLAYGFLLMLSLGLAQVIIGGHNYVTSATLGAALLIGPMSGFFMDLFLVASHSVVAFLGLLLVATEPFLALLFLVTHEWRARLKYCGLMFGLVLVKALLYVWVSSHG